MPVQHLAEPARMLPSLLPAPCARSLSSPWLQHGITGHGAKPGRHCSPWHGLLLTVAPPGDPPSLPSAVPSMLNLWQVPGLGRELWAQLCSLIPTDLSGIPLLRLLPVAVPHFPPVSRNHPCLLPAHRGLCQQHAGVAQRHLHGEPARSHALYSSTRCRWAATHCTRCDRAFFWYLVTAAAMQSLGSPCRRSVTHLYLPCCCLLCLCLQQHFPDLPGTTKWGWSCSPLLLLPSPSEWGCRHRSHMNFASSTHLEHRTIESWNSLGSNRL